MRTKFRKLLCAWRRHKSVPPRAINDRLPSHLKIGILGENIAAEYYIEHGFIVTARNFVLHKNEIDIIAESKTHIVFCEVKTRIGKHDPCHEQGRPALAVTKEKQRHLIQAASYFVMKRRNEGKHFRFDILEVYLNDDLSVESVYPIENAFSRD